MLSSKNYGFFRGRVLPNAQTIWKRSESFWGCVEMGPPDEIFGLTEAWRADKNPKKVNLGVGAYRDDEGKPFILPSVRKAEENILKKKLNHEYSPIVGITEFRQLAAELAFGGDACVLKNELNATVQSVSGTGALSLAAIFLKRFFPGNKVIYVPKPTWGNHHRIFKDAGLEIAHYRYYEPKTRSLDFCGLSEDIAKIPEKSVILFHAIAHNPTGVDPSKDQWREICDLCKGRKLMVFFDMAYQGFATGDLDNDAFAVRHFAEEGHKIILAQSFAKNMGLYGQRIGALTVLTGSRDEQEKVLSQLKIIIRGIYSNPPINGGRIVSEILSDNSLKCQWLKDVKAMSDRIFAARKMLVENLKKAGSQKNWDHITAQIGMFCFTGLTAEEVKKLVQNYSIYLMPNGRISVAGVGSKNVEYLGKAMHDVTK